MMKIVVITVSDSCSEGKRKDTSGLLIRQMVRSLGEIAKYEVIPDEKASISQAIRKAVDELKADLVLTTGGTGLSFRDVTPEATREVIEKEIPGFGEFMRQKSFEVTPRAILSRAEIVDSSCQDLLACPALSGYEDMALVLGNFFCRIEDLDHSRAPGNNTLQ